MEDTRTHIAVIPTSGSGHLIPIIEFARNLLIHIPSFFFTFILIPSSSTSAASPSALTILPSTSFHVIHLPLPSFPAFSNTVDEIYSRIFRSVNNSLTPLRETLETMTLKHHVAALIVDLFATEIIHVGSELRIKSYVFFSPSAMALSTFLHLPDHTNDTNDWRMDKALEFPGCPVIQVKDLPDMAYDLSSLHYKWFVGHCKRMESAEAILLNSFNALEEGPIRALTMTETPACKKPVYVVGPLVRVGSKNDDPSGCLRWLDEQPPESVLYVSFGSGGTLSTEQVTELAWGLELSHQGFIWVVRSPNDSASLGAYLTLDEKTDPLGFLPSGFLERTKERGFVVLSWAPQVEILGHVATGGFMTHCGWNSVLEGVHNGVGFIVWPLYAEQHMNAVELMDSVEAGIRVQKDKDGVVRRDEIARVVKELMEGEEGREIKERMSILKEEAKRTMSQDGLSNATLSKLAHMLNDSCTTDSAVS